MLDLSAHDLLGSKEPADLLFAAAIAKTQRLPALSEASEGHCIYRSGGVPESSSRYLLQLINAFPDYYPGYPAAISYSNGGPVTQAQCLQEARAACVIDQDEEALAAPSLSAYSREHVQAMWGSAQRLYPQATRDYLLQTEAPVSLPDMWGWSFGNDLALFAKACKTASARDSRWLDVCLALTERIETESDELLQAAVAGGIALTLLEGEDRPEAAARASERKQARNALTNCYPVTLNESNTAQLQQAFDLVARVGEIEAMRKICGAGLAAAHSSPASGH